VIVKRTSLIILSSLILFASGVWGDGPSYQKPELIKQQLDEWIKSKEEE